MDLLLLSNSTAPGRTYLEHALDEILEIVGARVVGRAPRLAFVPYALHDHDAYTAQVASTLAPSGIDVVGVHTTADPRTVLSTADAVFVGGGNTFRLVDALHRLGLVDALREAVRGGLPYLGSSAGTNVAAPTLRTTNDMPIVEPPSFETLDLVPFQINPHYLDPVPGDTHQGETREQRITQFHEVSALPVLGMREGTWLRVSGEQTRLHGDPRGARLFRQGADPVEVPVPGPAGVDLAGLLPV